MHKHVASELVLTGMYVRIPQKRERERERRRANPLVAVKYDMKFWSFGLDVGLSVKKSTCKTLVSKPQ